MPEGEQGLSRSRSWIRQGRVRESRLWTQSLCHVSSPPPDSRWVVVADRGADIYEHLLACQERGLGFVVRACQDRGLVGTRQQLFSVARSQPVAGQFCLTIRSSPTRSARRTTLAVSFSPPLALRAPQRPGTNAGKGQSVTVSVVRVWEPGSQLEWLLLCNEAVSSFAQARERAWQYATRWLIEDFHKALKTGLGAERLQLHTGHRLFAAVALLSVVDFALVDLREQSRQQSEAPIEQIGWPSLYLHVLSHYQQQPINTVGQAYDALAKLGGHLGRSKDAPPGWQTLWRGLLHLRHLIVGWRLAIRSTISSSRQK
ncbi:IS4 family transposase [Hymenobacter montanus]|uniref:IS4 family transposase n=1 Tax=Hymenobacter montanus TaxID=2771359 RepID=UPI003742D376